MGMIDILPNVDFSPDLMNQFILDILPGAFGIIYWALYKWLSKILPFCAMVLNVAIELLLFILSSVCSLIYGIGMFCFAQSKITSMILDKIWRDLFMGSFALSDTVLLVDSDFPDMICMQHLAPEDASR